MLDLSYIRFRIMSTKKTRWLPICLLMSFGTIYFHKQNFASGNRYFCNTVAGTGIGSATLSVRNKKGRSTLNSHSQSAETSSLPRLTYFGVNSLSLDIGGKRLLIDPFLVDDLVFYGQTWAFRGSRRPNALAAADKLQPEQVSERYDAIILTQGLDDHSHRPTLKRISRSMPIIASPSAAKVVKDLGFSNVTTVKPGSSCYFGADLQIFALPGSVVGPPWQDPENGYVFSDLRVGGMNVALEPHGNFLGPAIGTSFKALPKAPEIRIDALVVPLTAQRLGSYQLVNGAQEALETLQALDPTPRVVIPLRNGEIDSQGAIGGALSELGSVEEFRGLLKQNPKLHNVQIIDMMPGNPFVIEFM